MINFSKLLWKPQRSGEGPRSGSASLGGQPETVDKEALDLLPVVQAQITPETRIVVATEPNGAGADRFRLLRMRLRELRVAAKVRTILIGSPLAQDGKTTVVMNLATILAENGKRSVLVIEADLHRPRIAEALKLTPTKGLAECLEERLDPISVLRKVDPLGWYLMQSGTPEASPSEILMDDALGAMLQTLELYFDWILIDTPPLTALTDAVTLARHADTSLLVVRADRTPKPAIAEALDLLGPKQVLGIIFNGGIGRSGSYYSQYTAYRKQP